MSRLDTNKKPNQGDGRDPGRRDFIVVAGGGIGTFSAYAELTPNASELITRKPAQFLYGLPRKQGESSGAFGVSSAQAEKVG